jgi:vacuolar protein 8
VALLQDGTDALREKAVQELLNMARIDCKITSAGGITPLVALVQSGNDSQKERAAGALANLACKNAAAKVAIASAGAIPALVALIRDGNDAQKTNAATALRSLAVNKQNKALVVASDVVDLLVGLAEHGTPEQQENASGVIWDLDY